MFDELQETLKTLYDIFLDLTLYLCIQGECRELRAKVQDSPPKYHWTEAVGSLGSPDSLDINK